MKENNNNNNNNNKPGRNTMKDSVVDHLESIKRAYGLNTFLPVIGGIADRAKKKRDKAKQ